MRKIVLVFASMLLFSYQAFADFSYATWATGAKGSVNVEIQQGNSKIKFSASLSKMDLLVPNKDGFGFQLTGAGALAKGSCTVDGTTGFETCAAVTVDSAVQTTVTISVNGKLAGYSDGSGSGGVTWVFQGMGANVVSVTKESHGLASVDTIVGFCDNAQGLPAWCSSLTGTTRDVFIYTCESLIGTVGVCD